MNLKSATLFTIISICYFFIVRTVGTIIPNLFADKDVAQAVQLLSFIASLAPVVFLIYFYKDYTRKEQVLLKNTTIAAMTGSALLVLLYLRGLFIVFPRMSNSLYHFSPLIYSWVKSYHIEIFAPLIGWLSAIIYLLFFTALYRETFKNDVKSLRIASLVAILGSSVAVLIRSLSIFLQVFTKSIHSSFTFSPAFFLPFFILTLIGIISILYFLYTFYRIQE